jgi:hypothetical protein
MVKAWRTIMPIQEILILAVTHMLGGVCIAGMSAEPDPVTGLSWERPTREHSQVLLGDITTAQGQVISPFDVVEFELLRALPRPPHVEDWIADFRHRPRIARRLEGERRAVFLGKHLDRAPQDVLQAQSRSLCLIRPDWVRGCFHLDPYSGKFEARLSLGLAGLPAVGFCETRGWPVTDVRWRALGRSWLPAGGGAVELDYSALQTRLGITDLYLALGLTRSFQGTHWPMVIGVHTVPDYSVEVAYDNL